MTRLTSVGPFTELDYQDPLPCDECGQPAPEADATDAACLCADCLRAAVEPACDCCGDPVKGTPTRTGFAVFCNACMIALGSRKTVAELLAAVTS